MYFVVSTRPNHKSSVENGIFVAIETSPRSTLCSDPSGDREESDLASRKLSNIHDFNLWLTSVQLQTVTRVAVPDGLKVWVKDGSTCHARGHTAMA